MGRLLLKLACIAGVLYLCVVAGFFFAQRALIFPAPREKVAAPPSFTEVSYPTSDGLRLTGAYRRAATDMPTVVFFHGNGDNWNGAATATSRLASAGYGVFLPEYRGYSGNPGSPDEDGLYEDGRAALAWLETQGVNAAHVAIIGNSIGSGVAVQMALEHSPAAVVLVSPLASLPEAAAASFPWLPARWLVRDRFDNLAKIERVGAPVLILHGRADRLIPADHAERLARKSPRARLELFGDAGHELAYLPSAGEVELLWLNRVFAVERTD